MSTPVYSPGIAQAVLQGTIAGNPWAVVWHFQIDSSTTAWSSAGVTDLAISIKSMFPSPLLSMVPTNVTFNLVTVTDLTNATPFVGVSTGAAFTGTATGVSVTAAACALIGLKITARYRGGHPRTYWPGIAPGQTTDGENLTTLAATNYGTNFALWVTQIVSNMTSLGHTGVQHVVPRYSYTYTDDPVHHKYKKTKAAYLESFVVQSYPCNPKIATQRRRLQTV